MLTPTFDFDSLNELAPVFINDRKWIPTLLTLGVGNLGFNYYYGSIKYDIWGSILRLCIKEYLLEEVNESPYLKRLVFNCTWRIYLTPKKSKIYIKFEMKQSRFSSRYRFLPLSCGMHLNQQNVLKTSHTNSLKLL